MQVRPLSLDRLVLSYVFILDVYNFCLLFVGQMPQSAAAKERRSSSSPLHVRDAITTPPRGPPSRHVQHSPSSVTPPPQHAQRQNVIQTNPAAQFNTVNGGSAWSALVDVASSAPNLDVSKHHNSQQRYALEYAQQQVQAGAIRAHQNKWGSQQVPQRPHDSKSPYHPPPNNNVRHHKDNLSTPPPSKSPSSAPNGPTAATLINRIIVNQFSKADGNNESHLKQNTNYPYKPKVAQINSYERSVAESNGQNNSSIVNTGVC